MESKKPKYPYLNYLNAFHRYCKEKHLPGNAKLLYFELLALFNEARWPVSLQVDNLRLMSLVDTRTERVAISARDKLVDAGFIRYRKGKKGSPNTYYLLKYTPQKISEFYSESDCISVGETVGESCSHIKNETKTKTKKKIILSGGDGGAAPAQESEAADAVAEYLTDRGIDKSLYLGVTDEVMAQAEQIANKIFSKFTTKKPTESDISRVFDYTHERKEVQEETQISFSEERIKLLAYAFEQAADIGKPGNWRYIAGVMGKLERRGIKTIEQAEDYDYERDCRI